MTHCKRASPGIGNDALQAIHASETGAELTPPAMDHGHGALACTAAPASVCSTREPAQPLS